MSDGLSVRPYKGLVPYDEADALFFFGREAEQEIITANLLASRLTLLYGPSGVGKSSVLRAGVVHHLRKLAEQNLIQRNSPEFAVVVFSGWRDDPLKGLAKQIQETVSPITGQTLKEGSLIQTLQFWSNEIDGDLLIILDQFEEYFLYHAQEEGEGTFAHEFPRALNRPDLRASFLVSIREDALAKLDRFKGRIPNLFDNYLRIDHLDQPAARAAVEKPIAAYNRLTGQTVTIEPALVDAVLDQVRTGQVTLGSAGRGTVEGADDARIETPYLQLVMTRLWDEEVQSSSSPILRLSTLHRLGGADRIVRTHLDTTMSALPPDERNVAAEIYHYLVTPSGTKIAHTAADLAEYVHVPPSELEPVLEKLSSTGVRILRPVAPPLDQPGSPRYEIFHDVLAGAILDWRTRYVQGEELAEAERRLIEERAEADKKLADARHRANKLRWGMIGLSLLLLLIVGLAVFAFQQRSAARHAQQTAVSRELSAAALNNLEIDPERSILLALQAVSISSISGRPVLREAEEALHRAVQASRVQLTLAGHTAAVHGVAFSPDGKGLATASVDKTAKVWDMANGKTLLNLSGHTGVVNKVAFSPDGKRLATTSTDKTAKVWDVATGKELLTLEGHDAAVTGITFSPDGMRLATASLDKTARIWDAKTGRELLRLVGHTDAVQRVAFSSDGKRLATGSDDTTSKVWDAATGQVIHTLSGHFGSVWGVAFSPDGARVATASFTGSTQVWDANSGRLLLTLPHPTSNNALAYDPAGTRLVVSYGDGLAIVWDAARGQMLYSLAGHTGNLTDVAFSPDGSHVATASGDRNTKVWNVGPSGGQEWLTLSGHAAGVRDIAYSPDGKRVATASLDKTARVWDASTGKVLLTLSGHSDALRGIAFSPDGSRLATISDDWTAKLWDAATGQALITLSAKAILRGLTDHSLAFSPDGKRLATISNDKNAQLFDVSTGKALLTLSGHTDRLFGIAFSPNETRVVTSSGDETARVWDAATGKQLFTLSGHTSHLSGVAFSPDGRRLATGSRDGTARVWDGATGKQLFTLSGHRGIVFSVAFSPDGRRLATSSADLTVKLWDISTAQGRGQELLTLGGHTGSIYRVVFSPDGRRLATASMDGTSRIYVLPIEELVAIAKSRVTRTLTASECQKFLHMDQCPPVP